MYDALNSGNIDVPRLRQVLADLPMPQAGDGRMVLAVDISHWLRPDAPTLPDRLFCHVYSRSGRSSDLSAQSTVQLVSTAVTLSSAPPAPRG